MTDVYALQYGGYVLGAQDDIEGDAPVEVQANQYGGYVLAFHQADEARSTQAGLNSLVQAETATGLLDAIAHQFGAYALVRGLAERQDLRCWTFTQDDHDFYVMQLGSVATLVYDKLTQQWAEWNSPTFEYWRGNDGCDWEGLNVCCDTENGKIWKIDPVNRLDYGTTPITSVVTGGLTERFRKHVPVFMAELAISESEPPVGIDATTVGITLRTFDGANLNSVNHGTIVGEDIGDDITVRWYGLGLMKAPGQVFEITDTGYARRIDGLNIEVGNQ